MNFMAIFLRTGVAALTFACGLFLVGDKSPDLSKMVNDQISRADALEAELISANEYLKVVEAARKALEEKEAKTIEEQAPYDAPQGDFEISLAKMVIFAQYRDFT